MNLVVISRTLYGRVALECGAKEDDLHCGRQVAGDVMRDTAAIERLVRMRGAAGVGGAGAGAVAIGL
jgi:hypothetical protein